MLNDATCFKQIYIVCGYTDLRYGIDSLAAIIKSKLGFCIGKKNWVMIDTIVGAEASAIIYSIAETAKANNLKPYDYFEYLLTEIPKHIDDYDVSFCENLLPWSDKLPAKCRKS